VFAREAKVQGLKSRAAFKLLEVRSMCSSEPRPMEETRVDFCYLPKMDAKYRLFKKGAVVVDLVSVQSPFKGPKYHMLTLCAPTLKGLRSRVLVPSG
jgi:hypothetical protein